MDVLGYACIAVIAFWVGWGVKTLRDLDARLKGNLAGVAA